MKLWWTVSPNRFIFVTDARNNGGVLHSMNPNSIIHRLQYRLHRLNYVGTSYKLLTWLVVSIFIFFFLNALSGKFLMHPNHTKSRIYHIWRFESNWLLIKIIFGFIYFPIVFWVPLVLKFLQLYKVFFRLLQNAQKIFFGRDLFFFYLLPCNTSTRQTSKFKAPISDPTNEWAK